MIVPSSPLMQGAPESRVLAHGQTDWARDSAPAYDKANQHSEFNKNHWL